MVPICTLSSVRNSTPVRENARPRALFATQCFSITYHPQKPHAATPAMSSGGVHSSLVGPSVMSGIVGRVPNFITLPAKDLGTNRASTGERQPTRAKIPSTTKYPVSSLFTRSFGRYLNRTKNPKRTQLPMTGNRMASCLVIASVFPCAAGLMDRCAPAYTANVAVARMCRLGSMTVTSAQHAWRQTRRT